MTNSSNNPVWVIAEQVRGKIPAVCLELLGQAQKLAARLNARVEAVLLGSTPGEEIERLVSAGAEVVYWGDAPQFTCYQPEIYPAVIVALARQVEPQIVLMGSTSTGRELAPLIAARLGTGLTAHCIDLVVSKDGLLEQRIPAYGGILSIVCPEKRPQIATVAQGVFPMPALEASQAGKLVRLAPPEPIPLQVQTLEEVIQQPEGVPLETAPVVVAGGVGAGSIEGWREIAVLAEVLHAALGATRPAVDEGWAGLDIMIGQSGKMVNPQLYIGVGLSGEQQHMVGITGAKVMVAINNDPKAPVFQQVDYGVVADCRQFTPILVEKIKELRQPAS